MNPAYNGDPPPSLSPLKRGARVALIAPASPVKKEALERAEEILRCEGFEPVRGISAGERAGYLAGSEARRAADFIWAFRDESIDGVICLRGGYGCSRLLSWIPFARLRDHLKPFLGHSDVTFMHAALRSRLNAVTFHGPNLADAADSPESIRAALSALRGEFDFRWKLTEKMVLRDGAAKGILLGGNLTCIAHLVGTPYFPNLEGALLLVEDVGEAQYRLDRMFTHLRLAGHLHRLEGLVLGRFKDCGDPGRIHEMFLDQVKDLNIPVIAGLPFGHGAPNNVVALGATHAINTYENEFRAIGNPFAQ